MKQILVLFFTFSGICSTAAQDAAAVSFPAGTPTGENSTMPAKDTIAVKKLPTIKVLSNPVRNKAEIAVNGFEAGEVQVILSDSRGNRIRDDRRLLFSGIDIITIMFSLPAGIYFIAVKQKGRTVSNKLLVR